MTTSAKKTRFAVKGLSTWDSMPTGPFDTHQEAINWLAQRSDSDHIKRHFGNFYKWADFMIYKVN